VTDERLYLEDDADLGVMGETDPVVVRRHLHRYAKAIKYAEVFVSGGVWLDFACGSGYGTSLIGKRADFALGVDRDITAVTYAIKHHGSAETYYTVGTAGDVWDCFSRFGQREVPDVCLCVETLEHLDRESQETYIESVALHLAPKGCFVAALPLSTGRGPLNPWHLYEPTEQELRTMLRRSFKRVTMDIQAYESTSGPALQCYAVCTEPKPSR
jgi:2-polyprenyl-3-methyl-5-hydroxy-6-metoxy-1,4-benzoquinol methylase